MPSSEITTFGDLLRFEEGKIVSFKAEKGSDTFKKILEKAEGDKDRIAELGIGINYGMKPVDWSVYDEKALGTAHITIGNNTHRLRSSQPNHKSRRQKS